MIVRAFSAGVASIVVHDDAGTLAPAAADAAAATIAAAVADRGRANVMFASGNSQLAFLDRLVGLDLPWAHVVAFHMDEYVGIAGDHPASFRRYMRARIADRVPLSRFHYLAGDAPDPTREAARYATLLAEHPLDLCCLGIGENAHLAFNDPPVADFDDPVAAKIVVLDDECRDQQVGEGHFAVRADVPTHAITVTIPTLIGARSVLVVAPESRKARAVAAALQGPVETACPASILQRCAQATVHLDRDSAALLR